MNSFAQRYRDKLQAALGELDLAPIHQAIEWFRQAREDGRQIFVCGNGGSASTASHLATDLVKGASYGRRQRFRILALTDSLPTITAYANDTGYENVFAEQLKNFAQPGDLLVAISSSGNSPNLIRAVECARACGCRTIGLTGRDGGRLGPLVDLEIRIPETHTGRIEDGHMIVCHMIGYYFMEEATPSLLDVSTSTSPPD